MVAAFAQEPVVVLPEVTYAAPAAYPASAQDAGVQGVVRLELDVDERGVVRDARVLEAPSDDLGAAAVDALLASRFKPATVDGAPIGVTIVYAITFRLDRIPQPSIEGRALKAGERTPLPDATIELIGPDGALAYARTDDDGRFIVYDALPGTWSVRVTGPGVRERPVEVEVEVDKVVEVKLYAALDRPWEIEADEVIEVTTTLGRAEVTERRLDTTVAMSLPGTNGDILKAVLNFPGVARPPLGIGQLIVRGNDAADTRYYVDGVRIPQVFHFGGLSTVLNGDGLEQIRFLTGNYSVRYGDGLGGVVDLLARTSIPTRSRGYVSIDVYQAGLFVEQRLGPRTLLTVSGRRSYADAVLGPILGEIGGGSTFQAPRYYDAQVRLLHRTPQGGVFDALVLFSDDQFRLLRPDSEVVRFGLGTTFLTGSLGWRSPIGGGWRSETRVVVGPERQSFTSGDDESFEEAIAIGFRQELDYEVPEDGLLGWRFGIDLRAAAERFELGGIQGTEVDQGTTWRVRPAADAEATVRLGPVDLIPGVRASILALPDTTTGWVADPRLAMTARLGPTTTLTGTTGRFSQFPDSREQLPTSRGEPTLRAPWNLQTSVGLQQRLPADLSLELTGYWNEAFDLVSGREDRFDFAAGPPVPVPEDVNPYSNNGRGRAYGGELLFRLDGERTAAWLSATVGRAERKPQPDSPWNAFAFDQTLFLTALANHRLPKGWTIGGRLRVGTGNPYFPIANRIFNPTTRDFIPLFAEETERLRTFWSLDVRIDKTWTFNRWALTLYLDIQNITDPGNIELQGYSYDFSEENPIRSTPPLPAFGLKGAW